MSRNEAAERLRRDIEANEEGVWRDEILSDLDEALATERRLTVERVRERLLRAPLWSTVAHREDATAPKWAIDEDAVRSILDDLATADVDEEAGK